MTRDPVRQVVRFRKWLDPIFDETIAARGDIRLEVRAYDDPRDQTLAALARAHVLVVSAAKDEVPREWCATGELLSGCPSLLCVSSSGAGYDTIDVDACTRAGVAVVNQAGGNATSVAEHTIGLLLAVSHRIAQSDRWLRSRRGFTREDLMGRELAGLTIGLVGIGHVGTRVAALARAFGMRVVATDPPLAPDEIGRRGATPVSLDELVAVSDVVSLHCPRLASTLKMFSAPQYARMKKGAIFLSPARGGIHDEAALYEALDSGHLAGAGLDVWHVEPPPLDSPLLQHESVVSTYHTAGVTREARRNIARIAAEQIVTVLDGHRPPRLLNPEVWDTYRTRFEQLLGRAPE
jgi:D-3-phosphoglycerate dehydrogenase / 2-oxoglutarate reductase